MPLQCVILAGGLGTRMRPFTESLPKALLPVKGVPFADWQLAQLARQGVERVVYSVGYLGWMLKEHVGDGSRFGLSVTWVDEGEELRGTGGALRLALDRGALDDAFFVLYGDSYLPVALREVERASHRCHLPALMTVMRNEERWDASNAILADGRVVLYDKSRPRNRLAEMRWIDYGLSMLTSEVVATRIEPQTVSDLGQLYHDLSIEGSLAGFEVAERFYEIGTAGGLADLEAYLSERAEIPPPRR
ncbi:MAG: NTP transferase domain-containing protein [bacterium]|jgi:NDP-sugar pyrophosphorylase family protein|nr:NTP transferase domain-containing protein [bacterium]